MCDPILFFHHCLGSFVVHVFFFYALEFLFGFRLLLCEAFPYTMALHTYAVPRSFGDRPYIGF